MKQLRYWLHEKSFVTFVVGGVLLTVLTGSTIYLLKHRTVDQVAVTDTGEAKQPSSTMPTELPGSDTPQTGANSVATSDNQSETTASQSEAGAQSGANGSNSSSQIASVDQLPQTGSGINWAKLAGVLGVCYSSTYAVQRLRRRN